MNDLEAVSLVVAPNVEGVTRLQDTEHADEPLAHAVAAGDVTHQLLLAVARTDRVRGAEVEKGAAGLSREPLRRVL
jgi:hypothetical protein